LGNYILEYDVIYDAIGVLSSKNLKRPRHFGNLGSGRNKAENREIRKFFSAISGTAGRGV
jgi:hypothetical protein